MNLHGAGSGIYGKQTLRDLLLLGLPSQALESVSSKIKEIPIEFCISVWILPSPYTIRYVITLEERVRYCEKMYKAN